MAIELLNISIAWFEMFIFKGNNSEIALIKEIKRVSELPEIENALYVLSERKRENIYSKNLKNKEYEEIKKMILQKSNQNKLKKTVKKFLLSI